MTTPTPRQPSDPAAAGPIPDPGPAWVSPRRDLAVVAMMLAPALAAIWSIPWFLTQDGPAHLYNAAIIIDSLRGCPVFGDYYVVRWEPLPNWGGHLTLTALLATFPPRTADRLMTTLTLLAVAFAAVWLRGKVAGGRPSVSARALAALSAMSFSWLMGFASFQLGACLFAVTLGVWWPGRDALRPGRMAALAALLTVGYFCHLVSLGLTVFALGFLAIAAPADCGERSWRDRIVRLGLCLSPLVVLGFVYLGLSRRGGAMVPRMPRPDEFLSIAGWMGRLGWVDPVSLKIKTMLPFTDRSAGAYLAFAPIVWLAAGGLVLGLSALRASQDEDRPAGAGAGVGVRRAWLGLSALLILAGIFGPDSMGPGHGDYLPQRVALLGLIAAIPAIGPPSRSVVGGLGSAALVVALALQSLSVWDYGLATDRTAGRIARAAPMIGEGRRVGTLLGDVRTPFRVNAMLHADCWLGVDGGNIVWSNYETRHYYFPVHFRDDLHRPDPYDLQEIALLGTAPAAAERRRLWWERLMDEYHQAIDVLLVWREDPALDAVSARWFEPDSRDGEVRVFKPREAR
ncbi:hypothetical protein [Planctomyces sp. SH-PL62]|uniref:hypothetical protein n=1 Tax=Planctomyces sp. SH-PL62 TaxID=1636152 RepID=UPI00078EF512|nr:hypothetical protein [Planctomyces sp. SH-PL62]AMV36559.1 hypothetical protein VT85_03945 [Planctomyces sp. SH-PL62]